MLSIEVIISVGASLLVAVLGIITSFSLQKKADKQEIKVKTFESLDEENKELRKSNYELQLMVLDLQRKEAKRDRELEGLARDREEIKIVLDKLTKDLFLAREREFQLESEIGLLKSALEECQRRVAELFAAAN